MAIFGQQQCQKVTADGSRSVCKCRLVKQSTLVVSLSVPWHRYSCICTTPIQYVKPYGVVGCHYSVCTSLRGVMSRIDIVFRLALFFIVGIFLTFCTIRRMLAFGRHNSRDYIVFCGKQACWLTMKHYEFT